MWLLSVGIALGEDGGLRSPRLTEGTRTLGVSGHMDGDDGRFGAGWEVAVGVFPVDQIELGAFGALAFRGSDTRRISLGGYFLGYLLIDPPQWVPYFGAGLGVAYDRRRGDTEVYLEIHGCGGIQVFVVDHAAIGAELLVTAATAAVYQNGRHYFDGGLRLFTRWYF